MTLEQVEDRDEFVAKHITMNAGRYQVHNQLYSIVLGALKEARAEERKRAEELKLSLFGMLESYELAVDSKSEIFRDSIRGLFLNEAERAERALAAYSASDEGER